MSRFALSALEDAWLTSNEADTPSLSTEILGKITTCVLMLCSKPERNLLKPIDVESLFLNKLDTAPESIKNILHLEYKVAEVAIQESTQMTLGVQRAGIAGRLNPGYENLHVKCSPTDAYALLQQYEQEYPDVVGWIKEQAQIGVEA